MTQLDTLSEALLDFEQLADLTGWPDRLKHGHLDTDRPITGYLINSR